MQAQSNISRRAATEADVPFLLELRRVTMSEHQLASGVVPSEQERLRRVLARFECAEVVLDSGKPVGLLKVARDGTGWELVQIQLSPAVQRAGVGSQLIRGVIAEARAAGASLRLSVLKANPARALYERLGFAVFREQDHAFEMRLGGQAPTEQTCPSKRIMAPMSSARPTERGNADGSGPRLHLC